MTPRIPNRDKVDDRIQAGTVNPGALAFLGFLDRERVQNPQRLTPFGGETARRAAVLVAGVTIDLDAPQDDA